MQWCVLQKIFSECADKFCFIVNNCNLYSVALFQVHHGFYSAYHNTTLRPGILNAVKRAKDYYGDLDIMVTGHSMGGAMAAFCGLDLTVIRIILFLNTVEMIFISSLLLFFHNITIVAYYASLIFNT